MAVYYNGVPIGNLTGDTYFVPEDIKVTTVVASVYSAYEDRHVPVNVNGKLLTEYWSTAFLNTQYPYYEIRRYNQSMIPLNEENAGQFLKAFIGSAYVPKYDYDHPQYTYILDADFNVYKVQWSANEGLRLYVMGGIASKESVKHINSTSNETQIESDLAVSGDATFGGDLVVSSEIIDTQGNRYVREEDLTHLITNLNTTDFDWIECKVWRIGHTLYFGGIFKLKTTFTTATNVVAFQFPFINYSSTNVNQPFNVNFYATTTNSSLLYLEGKASLKVPANHLLDRKVTYLNMYFIDKEV